MANITLPIGRTLVNPQGLQVVFDPAALTNWPDAMLPPGLPSPSTTPRAVQLKLTARRPFTTADSTAMQLVDEPVGNTEIPGAWGNAAGSIDFEPGIDYWRATNFDTSTGVYGWYAPYNTGTAVTTLVAASASDQWYGTGTFDCVFRLERADWLAQGDASYERQIANGPRFQIAMDPRPSNAATNLLHFRVTGIGNLSASQAALGATNGVPLWIRCSRNGGTLTISSSPDGTNWTTAATASPGGSVTDPGGYSVVIGGLNSGIFPGRYAVDGILTEFSYYVNGALVADIGMNDVAHITDTSWTATPPGKAITRTGGTLLGGATGTIEPRFTFTTPTALADFVLDMPAVRSGEVLVDEILLEAECVGGIYRDGRVHLS